jgi:hypothetical protein
LLTFRDGESRAPLVSQNVQTDAAVGVDIGVVDASGEVDLGRLEGVIGREVDGKEEDTARVWGVTLLISVSEPDDNVSGPGGDLSPQSPPDNRRE